MKTKMKQKHPQERKKQETNESKKNKIFEF